MGVYKREEHMKIAIGEHIFQERNNEWGEYVESLIWT